MPDILPVPNIRSQIERAGRAYFIDCGIGKYEQFSLSHDYDERKVVDDKGNRIPLIDLYCISAVEEVKHSRVESWQFRADPEWDAITQPNDPNPNVNWYNINQITGLIMAAMSQTDNGGENYKATALMLSVYGRRLAVLGATYKNDPDDIKQNCDMRLFYCDYVEYQGAVGAGKSEGGALVFKEQRNFVIRACNLDDDSIFPALTFDGMKNLNWTFTPSGVWPEPAQWVVEQSADGLIWQTQVTLESGARTADIGGTGTQYWRVTRVDPSIPSYMPESNIVKANNP